MQTCELSNNLLVVENIRKVSNVFFKKDKNKHMFFVDCGGGKDNWVWFSNEDETTVKNKRTQLIDFIRSAGK